MYAHDYDNVYGSSNKDLQVLFGQIFTHAHRSSFSSGVVIVVSPLADSDALSPNTLSSSVIFTNYLQWSSSPHTQITRTHETAVECGRGVTLLIDFVHFDLASSQHINRRDTTKGEVLVLYGTELKKAKSQGYFSSNVSLINGC